MSEASTASAPPPPAPEAPAASSKGARRDVIGEIFRYARVVVQLQDAKREASRDVNRMLSGAALLVAGGVLLAIAALFALAGAAALVHLYAQLAWPWAILSVAGGALVVGGIALGVGLGRVRKPLLAQTRAALRRQVLGEG